MLLTHHDHARIKLTIQYLTNDFVYSVHSNVRNGGLIALAAIGIVKNLSVISYSNPDRPWAMPRLSI